VATSVAVSTVAFATLGSGATVNMCVNAQHMVRVVGGSAGCQSGEQAVQIYTKAGADQRFALRTHSHTLNVFEQESSCTTGSTGSGNGQVGFFTCALYGNADISGSSVGSEDSSFVGPLGGPDEAAVTFHLARGDIQAAGIYDGHTASHFSITGGTGLYVGATGTVGGVFYNSAADFHWTVNYHR
jgi:hypothetical protein